MKHFPTTRQPARLEGLSDHITRASAPHASLVLVAVAALAAGITIGLGISSWLQLRGI